MKYALTQSSTSSLPFPNTTHQKKCVLLQVETAQSDSKEAGTFMTRRELLAHGGTSYSPLVSSMPLGRAWRPKPSRLRYHRVSVKQTLSKQRALIGSTIQRVSGELPM